MEGYPGTAIEITGGNFSPVRLDNKVKIGGVEAIVVRAEPTKLKVISSLATVPGRIEVSVSGGPPTLSLHQFEPFGGLDITLPHIGPPIICTGVHPGGQEHVHTKGVLKVLVVFMLPQDLAGTDPVKLKEARDRVMGQWQNWPNLGHSHPQSVYEDVRNVHNYYDHVSFHDLFVQAAATEWHPLSMDSGRYVVFENVPGTTITYAPNIRLDMLFQFLSEAAAAAVNEGRVLEDYDVMACVIFLNNKNYILRGWGDRFLDWFSYPTGGIYTPISLKKKVWVIATDECADWRRFAHELGHCLVKPPHGNPAPPELGVMYEDLYAADLPLGADATAEQFDMMGLDGLAPLFSGYNMEIMGYYRLPTHYGPSYPPIPGDIIELDWSRKTDKDDYYEVVAHGLERTLGPKQYPRCHLLKIPVNHNLCYYVEVRQRSRDNTWSSPQLFDHNIPFDYANHEGGVVITGVITGTMNNNQEMRFIKLMHKENVLTKGQGFRDDARGLLIEVVDDYMDLGSTTNRPLLVSTVHVKWETLPDTNTAGLYDLFIEQKYDSNLCPVQSPDIWVDHHDPGAAGWQPHVPDSDPVSDPPVFDEQNYVYGRVHNDGVASVPNVSISFYSVSPPGVGDNGSWLPMRLEGHASGTYTVPGTSPGTSSPGRVRCGPALWMPALNEHTAIMVSFKQFEGERDRANNIAQENIFYIDAPAASVPEPVTMTVAVRNPLKKWTDVHLAVTGVPRGFTVHFPNAWVRLGPLAETLCELTIIPTEDLSFYLQKKMPQARVSVSGYIPVSYEKEYPHGMRPAPRMLPIGGVTAVVTPKRRVELSLEENRTGSDKNVIRLDGRIRPALARQRIMVYLHGPDDETEMQETVTDKDGQFALSYEIGSGQKGKKRHYEARAYIVGSPDAAYARSPPQRIVR